MRVVGRVHDLLLRYPFRASDALQLAAALAIRSQGQRQAEFVRWDAPPRAAAESLSKGVSTVSGQSRRAIE
jgi:hypothetical protein